MTGLWHIFVVVMLRSWSKIIRRPVTLLYSLVQPLFWLLFFGQLMQRYPISDLDAGISYMTFLTPGICAMTVLFGASQSGNSIVRDFQSGVFSRMLSTPTSFGALHCSKVLADTLRLMTQAFIVFLLAQLLGARFVLSGADLAWGVFGLFLFGIGFASLSCLVALLAQRQETMGAFVHLINMPIFFTSTALVPQKHLPDWLMPLALWNPLSLAVENLRAALLYGTSAQNRSENVLVLLCFAVGPLVVAILAMRRASFVSIWEVR